MSKKPTWRNRFAHKEMGKDVTWKSWYGPEGRKDSTGSISADWRAMWRHQDEDVKMKNGEVNTRAFARYMRELRRTVRIVFRGKALQVNWATENQSYTDMEKGYIRISPFPLLSEEPEHNSFNRDQRIDVLHGIAMHEAAHNVYTPANAMVLMMNQGGMLQKSLFNLVEDGHIEACVSDEYPGFASYFDRLCDWHFTRFSMDEHIAKYKNTSMEAANDKDPEVRKKTIMEQLSVLLNAYIFATRSRHEMDLSEVETISTRHAQSVRLISECVALFQAVETPDAQVDERYSAAATVYAKFVGFLQPEMDGKSAKEIGKDGFLGNEDEQTIKDIMRGMGIGESQGRQRAGEGAGVEIEAEEDSTSTERANAGEVLSEQAGSRIDGAIEADLDEMEIEKSERMHHGSYGTPPTSVETVVMRRLPYADERYKELRTMTRKHMVKLKRTLSFRSTDFVFTEHGLEHGRLDPTRLHELAGFNERNIFSRKIQAEAPSVHLGVLVDESGSMRSTTGYSSPAKDEVAVASAVMLAEALKETKNVSFEFWGHTGDCSSRGVTSIESLREERGSPVPGVHFQGPVCMKYLDSTKGMTDVRVLGRIVGRGNNYDGLAIAAVGKSMQQNVDASRRKVMLVISDGMPSGFGYGGAADTTERIKKLRRQGVEVIGIYVGELYEAKDQMNEMYGRMGWDWDICKTADELPNTLSRLSRRILKWEREG